MVTDTRPAIYLRGFVAPDGRKHVHQEAFVRSKAKRVIVRAGRRGGKTEGVATKALLAFLDKRRVLYAAPTSEETGGFWFAI